MATKKTTVKTPEVETPNADETLLQPQALAALDDEPTGDEGEVVPPTEPVDNPDEPEGGDGGEPEPTDPVDPEPTYPTPVVGTVKTNQSPWAEALKEDGTYRNGTNFESSGSTVIDDGVVQLALAPANAGVHHLVYADGGYTLDDPSGDVSCLFAIVTKYPEALEDYLFTLNLLGDGERKKTLELRNGKWTDPEDTSYVLTDSVETPNTIQNVTRLNWFSQDHKLEEFELQAENIRHGTRMQIEAAVTIKEAPVEPGDKTIYPDNLPGAQYENYRSLNIGGRTSIAVTMVYLRDMCPTRPMPIPVGSRNQSTFYRALVGVLNQPTDCYNNGMDLLLDLFNTYNERALSPTHALRFMESVRLSKEERDLFQGLVTALIMLAPVAGRKEVFRTLEPRLEKLFIESSQVTNLRLEAWDNFKRYFA